MCIAGECSHLGNMIFKNVNVFYTVLVFFVCPFCMRVFFFVLAVEEGREETARGAHVNSPERTRQQNKNTQKIGKNIFT